MRQKSREMSVAQPVQLSMRKILAKIMRRRPLGLSPPYSESDDGVPMECAAVTDLLYSRLSAAELEQTESQLNSDERNLLAKSSPTEQKRLLLSLGVYYRIQTLLDKTKLIPAEPPENVHAMSRGKFARAGSFHYADMLMEGLQGAGIHLKRGFRILDFGCSSGRVVRVLAAAYPQMEWFGCDPNREAIQWASQHLPNIRFFSSATEPPLPYRAEMFDGVFAISIWSHFGPDAAKRWFAEMRRVIRLGGCLIFTTHGYRSLEYYARNGQRPAEQLTEIGQSLQRTGFWFKDEFGNQGDWGIKHSEWGTAFVAPEWWLTHLCPTWSFRWFRGGRVEGNQDLIVLERRL